MNQDEIFAKLVEIIEDIKGDIKVEKDTALIEGDIMDSLELINYLTQIEEQFGVEITMEELIENELGIIDKMIEFLSGKV